MAKNAESGGKYDWPKIKAEYITGKMSYRDLAEKHGIPLRTLADHAKKDKWVARRAKHRHKIVSTACRRSGKAQVEALVRLNRSADKLVDILERAAVPDAYIGTEPLLDAAGQPIYNEQYQPVTRTTVAAKDYAQIVKAAHTLAALVRDLNNAPGVTEQAQLDIARQRLEIEREKLRSETDDKAVEVQLGDAEEWAD